jgi:hypothetical protein
MALPFLEVNVPSQFNFSHSSFIFVDMFYCLTDSVTGVTDAV